MSEKLLRMGQSLLIIHQIGPQFVYLGCSLSDVGVSNTRAPQATVPSPFLFTLYTSDFQYNSQSCHLLKSDFVEWCSRTHLLLNVKKTKEMVVDFRRTTTTIKPMNNMSEEVGVFEHNNKMGVHLNSRLDYFLRKLRSFNACSKMLEIFYQSVMTSAIYCAVVC